MLLVNSNNNEITYTYESSAERNDHVNYMLLNGYILTHLWGGKGTNDPISATYRKGE